MAGCTWLQAARAAYFLGRARSPSCPRCKASARAHCVGLLGSVWSQGLFAEDRPSVPRGPESFAFPSDSLSTDTYSNSCTATGRNWRWKWTNPQTLRGIKSALLLPADRSAVLWERTTTQRGHGGLAVRDPLQEQQTRRSPLTLPGRSSHQWLNKKSKCSHDPYLLYLRDFSFLSHLPYIINRRWRLRYFMHLVNESSHKFYLFCNPVTLSKGQGQLNKS